MNIPHAANAIIGRLGIALSTALTTRLASETPLSAAAGKSAPTPFQNQSLKGETDEHDNMARSIH